MFRYTMESLSVEQEVAEKVAGFVEDCDGLKKHLRQIKESLVYVSYCHYWGNDHFRFYQKNYIEHVVVGSYVMVRDSDDFKAWYEEKNIERLYGFSLDELWRLYCSGESCEQYDEFLPRI